MLGSNLGQIAECLFNIIKSPVWQKNVFPQGYTEDSLNINWITAASSSGYPEIDPLPFTKFGRRTKTHSKRE